MTITQRSPITDPSPGDVLSTWDKKTKRHLHRTVIAVTDGLIEYRTESGRLLSCFGQDWRRYAEHAEVEKTAERGNGQ